MLMLSLASLPLSVRPSRVSSTTATIVAFPGVERSAARARRSRPCVQRTGVAAARGKAPTVSTSLIAHELS